MTAPPAAPGAFDAFRTDVAGPRLVEASAGTGKTHAIGSLVLRLLVEDVGAAPPPTIDQILVVTFTRAATGELRERIRARLVQAGRLLAPSGPGAAAASPAPTPPPPPDPAEAEVRDWLAGLSEEARQAAAVRLRRALRDYDEAAIFTIHGFCQRVLRDFAFESRVDFDAELVPDETALRRTAIHDYWALMAYDADPLALSWLMTSGRLNVEGLQKLGDALAGAPHLERVPAVPAALAEGAPGDLSPAPEAALAGWRAAWTAVVACWRQDGEAALALLAASAAAKAVHNGTYKADRILGDWRRQLDQGLAGDLPLVLGKELSARLQNLTRSQIETKTNKGKAAPQHPLFDACESLHQVRQETDAALAAWGLELRHGLAVWLDRELPERRRRARQQSFDDLLQQLSRALGAVDGTGERLARRIRGRYRAALIDEFQDTDLLQDAIFRAIFQPPDGPPLPFLRIGDPKQAIYAFRGADVFAYLRAVAALADDGRHSLATNHRSDQGMVEALNALWLPVQRPFLFQAIRYEPAVARHGDRLTPGGPALEIAYLPADIADHQANGKPAGKGRAERAAARAAAAAVAGLLRRPPLIAMPGRRPRPATAGDVAVLVRTNAQARRMQAALRVLGVPTVLQSDASVLDQAEAEAMRLLLAALLDPADAWALRAALVTPLLGLSAAEIEDLAADETAWETWVERFREWQTVWRQRGFLPAFRQLLDGSHGARRLLGHAGGERQLTNLLHLAELLHTVAVRQELGPEGLAGWLERVLEDAELRRQSLGDTAQLRLERDAAAVRLVTVHRSKGLEYPFVFCPFLWAGSQSRGNKDPRPIAFHDLDGDQALRLDIAAEHGASAILAAGLEALAEDLRLLYVALTRARHRCWLAWGPLADTASGALAYLFTSAQLADQAPEGDAAEDLERWRSGIAAVAAAEVKAAAEAGDDPAADPLWGRLKALADAHPRLLRARRLGRGDLRAERLPPDAALAGPAGQARRSSHPPRRVLFRSSFTALARGERFAAAAEEQDPDGPDHDAQSAAEATEPAETAVGSARAAADAVDRVPLADLVAGTRLGTGMHALLERIDFRGDGARWRQEAERLVARRALPGEALEPLLAALPTLLSTALGVEERLGFRLADIDRADRRDELNYILPVALQARDGRFSPRQPGGGVTPAAIAAVLERHPGGAMPADYPRRLRALAAAPLAGWLNGSLDLVFRRRGEGGEARWFLLDWKSNRLGERWADYAPERLTAAMAGHHYFLQAHLYALALHRHLTARLPDYSYERHFGGILYVFVRGVREGHPGSGVCFDRPPAARIQALDRLLREGRA
ncbi:MAG: UvrD-helicase domain-containing protein [Ardenticatenia bacterium]|nr:UvrD-helicase domain-containing protein [Ardenticatenia bacterium]